VLLLLSLGVSLGCRLRRGGLGFLLGGLVSMRRVLRLLCLGRLGGLLRLLGLIVLCLVCSFRLLEFLLA